MTTRDFIIRMAVFTVFITLFTSGISWIVTGKFDVWDLKVTFAYSACCTLFCSLLIRGPYDKICKLPRPVFFVTFLCLAALGVVLGVASATLILTGRLGIDKSVLLFSMIFGVVCSIAVSGYFELKHHLEEKISKLKAAEIENEQLRRLESEAHFNSLQAKLNPHFLFNTLNSLAALVYEDPKKAEQSIVRFSELYRSVLSISNQTFVSVAEELELIRDYLELEKLRFENQLTYSFRCPAELEEQKIPGLLIEPLVGNVIKHVLDRHGEAVRLEILIERKDSHLHVSVIDDGPGFDNESAPPGFGLTSVQERLRLLYGEDYSFTIQSKSDEGTRVAVRIPIFSEKE
jgi:sensor histidine kinase YesM